MKKGLLLIATILWINHCFAQKAMEPSNEIIIEGLIENNVVINLDSLKNYPATKIDSVLITNHLDQRKSSLKNIAVIPIKTFLNQVKIKEDNPKLYSEFYFVFVATDDYKVVFSWNEIFNHDTGQEIYIIVEKDGKKIENLEDRIAVFSQTDQMKGRRYVKSLKKIIVKRAE